MTMTKMLQKRRSDEWLSRINRKDMQASATHYRICSKHFISDTVGARIGQHARQELQGTSQNSKMCLWLTVLVQTQKHQSVDSVETFRWITHLQMMKTGNYRMRFHMTRQLHRISPWLIFSDLKKKSEG
ncbi:uncharacterized protein LOC135401151 isoform X2 [Ornithodoros turicata]|uniref:uncharacterized protein LOC135401151 isoform X2 n=1 Tax=Ornithodoros turicata TaxID=34597 RepID=UPI003138B511